MCYFCTRHITPDQLSSSHNVKFHLSCLKCEHCLDKISIHTLHYVNDRTAEEYARIRKPEYGHLKSGFYCKFHFKEFFTPNNITLINQSQDKEIEYIGADTPSTNTPEPAQADNGIESEPYNEPDINGEVIMRLNSSDLRRAKSVSSVRNLRDMFENISTGTIEPEVKDEPKPQNIFKKMMNIQRKNPGVETITKSKSLYSIPRPNSQEITPEVLKSPTPHTPQRRTSKIERTNSHQLSGEMKPILSHKSSVELRISQNSPPVKYQDPTPKDRNKVSSKFSINLNNLKYDTGLGSKKKKSGIAKKIDKKNSELKKNNNNSRDNNKFNSTASIDISSLKYSASSPCLGEDDAQHEALHDQPLHDSDEKRSSLFRQYSNDTLKKRSMLNFFNRKKPNFDRTTSLTLSNANDPLPALPKPEFIDVDEDCVPFERNSFSRATAPPNLSHDNSITEPDDLVDSSLCRRPSTAAVNLSREAVVIRSDSPQARSLLRSSIRNSKRFGTVPRESSLVNQNMAYLDTSYTKQDSTLDTSSYKEIAPQSPIIGGRISIGNTTPEKVLKKSSTAENLDQAFISKTICSPKLKRAEKVKIKNESNLALKDKENYDLKPLSSTPLYCRKSLSSLTSLETAEAQAVTIKMDDKMGYMRIDDSIVSKTICSPKLKRAEKFNVVSKKKEKAADIQKQHLMVDSNKLHTDIITKTICSPRLKRPERVNMIPNLAKKEKPLSSSSTISISSSSTSSSSGTFTTSDAFPSPGQVRTPLKWTTPKSSPLITNTDSMSDVFYTPEPKTPYLLQYEITKPTDAQSISSSFASASINLSDTDNQISDSQISDSQISDIQISDGSVGMLNDRLGKRGPTPFMYAKSSPTDPVKPEIASSNKPSVKPEPWQNIAAELDEIEKNLSKLDVPDKPTRTSIKRSTSNITTPPAAPLLSKYSRSISMTSPRALSSVSPRSIISSSSSPRSQGDAYTKKVLSRNSTPAEHASINQILQKYRKPQSRDTNIEGVPPPLPTRNLTYNDRQKPSNQRCTRDMTRSISGDKSISPEKSQSPDAPKSGRSTPRNRIKMISQLSASFDKSIDRLVNKYHNKSGVKGKTSPDPIVSTPVKTDHKIPNPKDDAYTSLKELSNLPSESTAESSSESISDRLNRSQSTRSHTTRDSAQPRSSIPIDPALLQYDRNSSFREKNDTPQNTSNVRYSRTRSTSNHYNPSKPPAKIERQQSMPAQRHNNNNNNNNLLYISSSPKMHNKEGTNSEYIQNVEKGDKSDYLKSLYYIYSAAPAISSRVENKFVYPQRKQTDV